LEEDIGKEKKKEAMRQEEEAGHQNPTKEGENNV
jgi:hypothetical protein